MWTLLLFLGLGGVLVLGEDISEECSRSRMETCTYDIPFFPETKEELKTVCPLLLAHLECNKNYEERCLDEEYTRPEMLARTISAFREICTEDSLLHAAIAGNLKCLKEVFSPETIEICQAITNNLGKLYEEQQNPGTEEEDYDTLIENSSKGNCLDALSNTACVVRRTSDKCGPVARGAVLEMFGRLRFFEHSCQDGYISDLMTAIPLLDITEEEKESLMEAFHLK